MRNATLAVLCALTATLRLGALETSAPLGPERLAEVAADMARRTGLEPDSLACRVMAASICYRFVPKGEGRWKLQKDDFIKRVIGYHRESFKPVAAAIEGRAMPDAHRRVLSADFARKCLWPVRYRYPPAPADHWRELVASIPEGSRLLAVPAGSSLHAVLSDAWSSWVDLSPAARKAVLDRLAAINPRLRPDGGFLAEAGSVPTGFVPGNGVDPLDTGFFRPLAELVPETDLTPAARQQWEYLPLPADEGRVWVCRYRLVPSDLLVPAGDDLASWADPPVFDLANLPLADAGILRGMHPRVLDLSGTAIADLAPLAGMDSLRELRLAACPVADLAPLAGAELELLDLRDSRVADLAPLRRQPLAHLDLRGAPATDLAPLAGAPLECLLLTGDGDYSGLEAVVAGASLATIGDVPVDTWRRENAWKRKQGAYWEKADAPADDDCGEAGADRGSPPESPPAPVPETPGGDAEPEAGGGSLDDTLDELLED